MSQGQSGNVKGPRPLAPGERKRGRVIVRVVHDGQKIPTRPNVPTVLDRGYDYDLDVHREGLILLGLDREDTEAGRFDFVSPSGYCLHGRVRTIDGSELKSADLLRAARAEFREAWKGETA